MVIRSVNRLVENCYIHGLRHVIISPGSRSAAITLAFARHPKIKTYVIYDERSAGYIALGISQALKKPVAIVCTSGTAVLNLYPSIAEAFYQHIPLLVLTADRPAEWIDQADGQSIHQESVFGKHVKKSFSFPTHESHRDSQWFSDRMVSEALILMHTIPAGPVHINVPLREPFYPEKDEPFLYDSPEKTIKIIEPQRTLDEKSWKLLAEIWSKSDKILLITGQSEKNQRLNEAIEKFANKFNLPVLADVISNYSDTTGNRIMLHDNFLCTENPQTREKLKPDLILSTGGSVISKNLKLYLRTYKPVQHLHFQQLSEVPDTFQTLTDIINTDPVHFFENAGNYLSAKPEQKKYFVSWKNMESQATKITNNFFPGEKFSELEACRIILKRLPVNINLHLSNSMPVRLVNYIDKDLSSVDVYANRGTSGIDGCSSTAVGTAMATSKMNVLITGDMAFFYDRNAFWHTQVPNNLRIIILNNHGGGIFRMIDGPSGLSELKEFFETNQPLTAANTAADFNMEYKSCNSASQLEKLLPDFYDPGDKPKILEIETDSLINKYIFDQFKTQFK